MQYFVKRGEKVIGPFSPEQLSEGIKSKGFKTTDELSVSENGGFVPLKEVYRLAIKGEWRGLIATGVKRDDGRFYEGNEGEELSSENSGSRAPSPRTTPPPAPGMSSGADYWAASAQRLSAMYGGSSQESATSSRASGSTWGGAGGNGESRRLQQIRKNSVDDGADDKVSLSNILLKVVISVVLVVVGISGAIGMYVYSKPLKQRWAADDAFVRLYNASVMLEAETERRLKRGERVASQLEVNLEVSLEQAAYDLAAIKDQMSPELRKAWEQDKLKELEDDYAKLLKKYWISE